MTSFKYTHDEAGARLNLFAFSKQHATPAPDGGEAALNGERLFELLWKHGLIGGQWISRKEDHKGWQQCAEEIAALVSPSLPASTEAEEEAGQPEVLKAAQDLVDRMEMIHEHPTFASVWMVNQIHAGPYTGPRYEDEFNRLKAALAAWQASQSALSSSERAETLAVLDGLLADVRFSRPVDWIGQIKRLAARLHSAPSEAEQIIAAAERMAQRTGHKFTVDPDKLRDFPSESPYSDGKEWGSMFKSEAGPSDATRAAALSELAKMDADLIFDETAPPEPAHGEGASAAARSAWSGVASANLSSLPPAGDTEPALRSAAKIIHDAGIYHGWFGPYFTKSYKELEDTDPIGFREFNDLIAEALSAAKALPPAGDAVAVKREWLKDVRDSLLRIQAPSGQERIAAEILRLLDGRQP